MSSRPSTTRRSRRRRGRDYCWESQRANICRLVVVAAITWIMASDRPSHTQESPVDPHAEKKGVFGTIFAEISGQTEPPFIKSNITYGFPVNATEHTLPPPLRTNQTTVVIVLSARNHFERRALIRETWALNNDNVYFVIGGPESDDKQDTDRTNPLSVSSLLFREQELYSDIIDSIHIDSYRSLPYKLHFGMKWIVTNLPQVNWVVKADDDHIVRVRLLQFFVLRKFNPHHPIVIGNVVLDAPPHKTGKWAEDPKFTSETYPPWTFGSAGYVVSRSVAQYIADQDDLYYYQGEDAGLGIWLAESPLQITWIDTPEVNKDKLCEGKYYIIGHDWTSKEFKNCYNVLGDDAPERKSIVAFAAARKDQHPNRIV